MAKLDIKNRKILYELYSNARISSKALAKKVGLSREVVDYRIKKLSKDGFIKNYITMVDFDILGYSMYSIYISLQDLDEESEKEAINYLKGHHFVKWVVSCSGKWDILIQVAAKGKLHLDKILGEIFLKLKPRLVSYEVLTSIKRYKDVDMLLISPCKEILADKIPASQHNRPKLLRKDLEILALLAENAKMNIVDIAKKVSLSAETTSSKIKALQKSGIIRNFRTVIDPSSLGRLWYMLLLDLAPVSPAMEKSIAEFCCANKNIFFADKTLGSWSLRIELLAKDHIEFHKILRKIRNHLKGMLKSYELLIMFEEFKQVSLTKGMAKEISESISSSS